MLKLTTEFDLTNEATCSLYVRSFLVGAVYCFKEDVYFRPQKRLCGRRGHGPVDFALVSRSTGVTISVTEIKREDLKKAIAQNIVQLEACLVCVMNVCVCEGLFLDHPNLSLAIDCLQAQAE